MTQEQINNALYGLVKPINIPQNLAKQMQDYGIVNSDDCKRFLANCLNETGGFTTFEENGYYSTPARLVAVFPSAFKSRYNPKNYIKNPQKLFNLVYDDRLFKKGLGNNQDGDGYKFRGRGAIQITGRNNYKKLSERTSIDFVSNPDLLAKDYKFISALDFWKHNGLSNKKTLLETRQVVAGNYSNNPFGYSEVLKWFNKLKT